MERGKAGGFDQSGTPAGNDPTFRLGDRGSPLILYLDTSALVKLYVRERESAQTRSHAVKAQALAA